MLGQEEAIFTHQDDTSTCMEHIFQIFGKGSLLCTHRWPVKIGTGGDENQTFKLFYMPLKCHPRPGMEF